MPSGTANVPLIFLCDKGTSGSPAIYESIADDLEFTPIPVYVEEPIAVAYSAEENAIYWIDASIDSINRAYRNGSDHIVWGVGSGESSLHVSIRIREFPRE